MIAYRVMTIGGTKEIDQIVDGMVVGSVEPSRRAAKLKDGYYDHEFNAVSEADALSSTA